MADFMMDLPDLWTRLEGVFLDLLSANDASLILGLVVTVVAVAIGFMFSTAQKGPNLDHIPKMNAELSDAQRRDRFAMDAKKMLQEGYETFNKGAFQIETSGGTKVILGPAQVDELARKGDHVINSQIPIARTLMTEYTKLRVADDIFLHAIKAELSTRLGSFTQALADETDKALASEMPDARDWTSVNVYSKILRIVAKVSTRIFLGEDLVNDEDWLRVSISYTIYIMKSSQGLKRWSPWLRPIVYRFLPEFRTMWKEEATALRLLTPIVKKRRDAEQMQGYEKPNDMLQWMMDLRIKKGRQDREYEHMAQQQLTLAFAAIHTTTSAVTHMLYDLAAMPEYASMIRQDLHDELNKNGGVWDGPLMKSLKKTDSFMKESQRHNPIGYTLFQRVLLQPVTLSDGTYLPKGLSIINNGHAAMHDPEIIKDPDIFDGLRYYKMRTAVSDDPQAKKDLAGKNQFVSVSRSSQMFGYGKHACPGRFFAGNEIKLILVKLLAKYDIKLENAAERYKNQEWESGNNPDVSKNILVKSIEIA